MERPGASERRAPGAAESASALAATRAYELDHDSGLRVEEFLLDLRPAADVLDREQLRSSREVEAARGGRHDGPVAVLREDLLRVERPQELQERLRLRRMLRGRGDGDRVFDQDRRLRDHELDGLTLLLREHGFVLVPEEDVTAAREKRLQPFARAGRLRDDVLPELPEIVDGLLRCLAGAKCTAVSGHHVPAGASRREWVRRDHLDARLEQVVPGLQLLRVAVTHDEDDYRACDHPLVLVLVPALRDELLLDE